MNQELLIEVFFFFRLEQNKLYSVRKNGEAGTGSQINFSEIDF